MAQDKNKDVVSMKQMSGEDFAQAFLQHIQERADANFGREVATMRPLEVLVKKTLGLPVPENDALPAEIPQLRYPPEFPQWRVRYHASGEIAARRLCESLEQVNDCNRDNFNYALPIDAKFQEALIEMVNK
jgi:hypothetical protein